MSDGINDYGSDYAHSYKSEKKEPPRAEPPQTCEHGLTYHCGWTAKAGSRPSAPAPSYDRDKVKRLEQELEAEAQGNNRFVGHKFDAPAPNGEPSYPCGHPVIEKGCCEFCGPSPADLQDVARTVMLEYGVELGQKVPAVFAKSQKITVLELLIKFAAHLREGK